VLLRFGGREKELWGGEPETTNNRMELTAAIEGLAAQFSGKSRRHLERSPVGLMSNIAMDEIAVDRFSANYSYENGRLVLSDVEMITAFLKAFLDVKIDVDESDPDNSVIQTARLTLRDVTDDAMGAFVGLEKITGKSFRSDEREFVIAVGGTIGKPVLKSAGEAGAAPEQEQVSERGGGREQWQQIFGDVDHFNKACFGYLEAFENHPQEPQLFGGTCGVFPRPFPC